MHEALLDADISGIGRVVELGRKVLRSRAGARHLLGHPLVRELATASPLRSLASSVLGTDATPFRVTLFDKSASSNWAVVWHQDTALPLQRRFEAAGWGPWSTKGGVLYAHAPTDALEQIMAIRLHLDDSTDSNGPLRVLPGTHNLGVLSDDAVSEIARGERRRRPHAAADHPLVIEGGEQRVATRPAHRVRAKFRDCAGCGAGRRLI